MKPALTRRPAAISGLLVQTAVSQEVPRFPFKGSLKGDIIDIAGLL